ncbi:YjcZ family sporulation protein [Peribacillus simplex]|uniref:YjcZ family sporulation protein n=1 Tax=Peribacillus simplex TaxID=1478 RepID=UPI003D298186
MYGGYNQDCCYPVSVAPSFGYGDQCCGGFGSGFAIIIVLFILLIIVGACLC